MEQFLYLGHQTSLENLGNILAGDYLYTSYGKEKIKC